MSSILATKLGEQVYNLLYAKTNNFYFEPNVTVDNIEPSQIKCGSCGRDYEALIYDQRACLYCIAIGEFYCINCCFGHGGHCYKCKYNGISPYDVYAHKLFFFKKEKVIYCSGTGCMVKYHTSCDGNFCSACECWFCSTCSYKHEKTCVHHRE